MRKHSFDLWNPADISDPAKRKEILKCKGRLLEVAPTLVKKVGRVAQSMGASAPGILEEMLYLGLDQMDKIAAPRVGIDIRSLSTGGFRMVCSLPADHDNEQFLFVAQNGEFALFGSFHEELAEGEWKRIQYFSDAKSANVRRFCFAENITRAEALSLVLRLNVPQEFHADLTARGLNVAPPVPSLLSRVISGGETSPPSLNVLASPASTTKR